MRAISLVEPLRLDGRLDEAIYDTVPPITGFFQLVPDEGAPSTEETEVWISFDEENVYASARVWDSAPESEWVANEMRRNTNQLRQTTASASYWTPFTTAETDIFLHEPIGRQSGEVYYG